MSDTIVILPFYQRLWTALSTLWPGSSSSSSSQRQWLVKQLSKTRDKTSSPTKASSLQQIKDEVERSLDHDVLRNWLPRSVDKEIGGYHQDYGVDWRRTPRNERGIVYQARNVWLAAHAALHKPSITPDEKQKLIEWSNHGVEFLADKMWDAEHGGFYWRLEGNGNVAAAEGEKHVYGLSFAIYALSENFKVTKNLAALELAKKAFWWLETHAHDAQNKGYYEALTREGTPILSRDEKKRNSRTHDHINTQYGFKSMNSHIHLLEAFTNLLEVWHEEEETLLRDRLTELFHLVRETIVVPEVGAMNLFFLPDWRPVPDHDSFGHDVETAFLLLEAAEALRVSGEELEKTWVIARRLVDHALEFGWDDELGGFYDAGTTFSAPFDTRKVWWIQAEGLNALAVMHQRFGGETTRYWDALVREWAWIRLAQIDSKSSGWIAEVERDGKREKAQRKSDEWTEGYHQGRALMNVAKILASLIQNVK